MMAVQELIHMDKEMVLYGKHRDRAEDWHEEILLTNATPELIEKVKKLAAKDGFECFRVAELDLSVRPDFLSSVNNMDRRQTLAAARLLKIS